MNFQDVGDKINDGFISFAVWLGKTWPKILYIIGATIGVAFLLAILKECVDSAEERRAMIKERGEPYVLYTFEYSDGEKLYVVDPKSLDYGGYAVQYKINDKENTIPYNALRRITKESGYGKVELIQKLQEEVGEHKPQQEEEVSGSSKETEAHPEETGHEGVEGGGGGAD